MENFNALNLASSIDVNIIESVADGDGVRLVLFLQGCPHGCPGCHNQQSWEFHSKYNYCVNDVFNVLMEKMRTGYFDGVTISGGEPLAQKGTKTLVRLLKEINVNVWVYTGYTFNSVPDKEILNYVDVLVDGKFVAEKRTAPFKRFRGSNNQRILHLSNGKIVKEE